MPGGQSHHRADGRARTRASVCAGCTPVVKFARWCSSDAQVAHRWHVKCSARRPDSGPILRPHASSAPAARRSEPAKVSRNAISVRDRSSPRHREMQCSPAVMPTRADARYRQYRQNTDPGGRCQFQATSDGCSRRSRGWMRLRPLLDRELQMAPRDLSGHVASASRFEPPSTQFGGGLTSAAASASSTPPRERFRVHEVSYGQHSKQDKTASVKLNLAFS